MQFSFKSQRQDSDSGIPVEARILAVAACVVLVVGFAIFGLSWI